MPRHGMFLQLQSMSLNDVIKHMEYAEANKSQLDDLCVTAIGSHTGELYVDKLAAIKPFLPGQSRAVFKNVFFGSQVDYTGVADPYGDGMLDSNFRWRLLNLQASLLSQLDSFLTGVTWHCYIEHEAPLNRLVKSSLRAAYEAFLIQSVRDLRTIRPGSAVLWSPAFWDKKVPTGMDIILKALFDNIKAHTDGFGINWLHLQDCQGRWFNPSYADSKAWFDALPAFPSKRMNLEYFEQVEGGLVPADKQEVEARISYYNANGIPLGISWEARWIKQVQEQPDVSPNIGLALIGTTRTDRASNWSWTNRKEVKNWLSTKIITGDYSARAHATARAAKLLEGAFPLEVQGEYYMRPYSATVSPGRSINSDHLTAGALDIFFRTSADKAHYAEVKRILDSWKARGVVRYYLDLGYNWAHRDHIHVSFQLGVKA